MRLRDVLRIQRRLIKVADVEGSPHFGQDVGVRTREVSVLRGVSFDVEQTRDKMGPVFEGTTAGSLGRRRIDPLLLKWLQRVAPCSIDAPTLPSTMNPRSESPMQETALAPL